MGQIICIDEMTTELLSDAFDLLSTEAKGLFFIDNGIELNCHEKNGCDLHFGFEHMH